MQRLPNKFLVVVGTLSRPVTQPREDIAPAIGPPCPASAWHGGPRLGRAVRRVIRRIRLAADRAESAIRMKIRVEQRASAGDSKGLYPPAVPPVRQVPAQFTQWPTALAIILWETVLARFAMVIGKLV